MGFKQCLRRTFSKKIYLGIISNEKKTRLLDLVSIQTAILGYGPRPSALSTRPLCSASNHDISEK